MSIIDKFSRKKQPPAVANSSPQPRCGVTLNHLTSNGDRLIVESSTPITQEEAQAIFRIFKGGLASNANLEDIKQNIQKITGADARVTLIRGNQS